MKGLLTTILMLGSTGLAYGQLTSQQSGQRTQNDFSSRQSTSSNSFAPSSNQTRLAALQSTSSVDDESDKYVIMDEVDYGRESVAQHPQFGPENDPRIRNAVQERPRYTAQSSERSAVSVLPSSRDTFQNDRRPIGGERSRSNAQSSNVRFASSSARDRLSIYDLQITPAYEDELKTKGFLYAPTTVQEAGSDQIRLFSDPRRADNSADGAKIVSSRVSTYQGNLIIDIDDQDLQRIEDGSYTLDDFDRYDARGVVLRYVSRNNDKVDVTRLRLGETSRDSYAGDSSNYRDVASDRDARREPNYRASTVDDRRREGDGYGDWVLPNSRNNDRRDLTLDRVADGRDTREGRDLRDSRDLLDRRDERSRLNTRDARYDASPIRDNYQDRMVDIYRDRTDRQLDRLTDRRDSRTSDEVSYNDRRSTSSATRDLIDPRQRNLERELVELSDWQKDLAIKTRELEAQERELQRLRLQTDSRNVRYETATSQARQYRPGDVQMPYENSTSTVGVNRYADSRLSTTRNSATPYSGSYNASSLPDASDPQFARYAKQNQEQLTRINKKMAAIEQANKLYALENQLDADHRQQQLKQTQDKLKNSGHVTSFNDDGLVRNTLGGNMAVGRNGYPDDRLASNVGSPFRNGSGVADMSLRSNRSYGAENGFNDQRSPQQYTSNVSSDKLARALWFVTLMSIGFNFYLALLARSFYSRYNELADELRETFTASI